MESLSAVSQSVSRLVGWLVSWLVKSSQNQLLRKEEKSVFYKFITCKDKRRRKKAKGSINIGKCQDTKYCLIYTTIYFPHQECCPLTFYTAVN